MLKVVAVIGSRNREGHTAQGVEAICRGVRKAGGTSESIFLPELNIRVCRQCDFDSWGLCGREQRCIIKDGFAGVMAKITSADALIFGTPVFVGDLSETMGCFLDRCSRVSHPPAPGGLSPTQAIIAGKFGNTPGEGYPGPLSGIKKTPTIGLSVAGGFGFGAPACLERLDTKLQKSFIFDVVDMIPIRRQNLDFKIPLLEATGEWLATIAKSR
jgi:hypothetical protein